MSRQDRTPPRGLRIRPAALPTQEVPDDRRAADAAREHLLAARPRDPARSRGDVRAQVTGTLRQGLRTGSWVLTDEVTGRVVEVKGTRGHGFRDGLRVILRGVLHTDRVTTSQQGTPFTVDEIVVPGRR
ncbi:hypothetical protein GIS00_16105 [Nakamurella sp. YIM 132087]|uniref:Uncharacterized protein n=1 Tax=Nakamurella alba TaxID=2665158 RepID=A0A7K1FQ25_9ACTN|nr:hypothetical protein [Nakamurella alba]MTD15459.1 hypothetical protein [Nakamurella alba]